MNASDLNFRAYQYAESMTDKLITICHPLFELSIKVFAYFRFFNDGRYLYLCNDLNWVRFCLQNIHNNEGTSLGGEINHVSHDGYHCYLWPTVKTDYLMTALYDHNIWHGLSIFRQRTDSIELWGFAGDRQSENMQSFYIENLELLKDFTLSFNMNAADIIIPNNNKLAIYKDFKPYNTVIDSYESKKIREFIKATPILKHPLLTSSGEIYVSKKELECLTLMVAGKSAKHISLQLNISHKTVEKHLEHIKRKLGCKEKTVICKIFKDSIMNWL